MKRAPASRQRLHALLVGVMLAAAVVIATNRGDLVVNSLSPSHGPLSIRGADISFTLQEEAIGRTFSDGTTIRPVEQILAARGANYVRLRVWVNPPPGYSDEAAALTLARRAHRAGLKILLDPHYSDFWADYSAGWGAHQNQTTPTAWQGENLAAAQARIRSYTEKLVGDFAKQGTPIDIIQLGNEVNGGILWPTGKVYQADGERWEPFASLLQAATAGGRAGNPRNHELVIMLHISGGADNRSCRYFFDRIMAAGVTDFDIIGLSYYPFWDGPLSALTENLNDLATRYEKSLVVVETAYPWTLEGYQLVVNEPHQLPEIFRFPPTESGQEAYFAGLRQVLADVPNGLGAGLLVWAPEWLPGVGVAPGAGNPFGNMTMWDVTGRPLAAIDTAFNPVRGE